MKNLRKEKDTTFVVPFSWRGAMRLERMPPHPEHIGDIMLAFRSIRTVAYTHLTLPTSDLV